jgi:hypothetical protein
MNQILLIFLISSASIIALAIIKRISKSACVRCSICYGLVNVERNIELENQEKQYEIRNNYNSQKTELPINIL